MKVWINDYFKNSPFGYTWRNLCEGLRYFRNVYRSTAVTVFAYKKKTHFLRLHFVRNIRKCFYFFFLRHSFHLYKIQKPVINREWRAFRTYKMCPSVEKKIRFGLFVKFINFTSTEKPHDWFCRISLAHQMFSLICLRASNKRQTTIKYKSNLDNVKRNFI